MKSSFSVSLGLLALLFSAAAFSQTTILAQTPVSNKPSMKVINKGPAKKKPAPKSAAVTVENAATKIVEKSSFNKFYDRLRIGYFGVLTTPTFYDMKRGNWDNAAISPEFGQAASGPKKNQDTWPTNMWNQISFNYNFGAKMNFVFNPRFMIPLAHSVDMKEPEDRSLIAIEDFLVGFQGVVVSSTDKKFNLWVRPGIRIPTSKASRNSDNGGFGQTTHQVELAYLPTYDFNKTWQLGIFGQVRQWVFEDRYNWSRLRLYTAPYVQYTIDDSTRLQLYYENMLENRRRWESINDQKPYFEDVWQTLMFGVNKDITPKLNIFPYVTAFINDVPFSSQSLFLGAWISYQIK